MRKPLLALVVLLLCLAAVGGVQADHRPTLDDVHLSPHAQSLDLGSIRIKDFDRFYALLDDHPNLRRVDMFETRIKTEQADDMTSRYPHITFGWTIRLVEDHYIRTDDTAFAVNHSKRSVTHSSEDFRGLTYCKELKALDLGHNNLTDISFLEELPNLQVLILAGNFITDITPLKSLKNLEYAELFNNYIADFSPLSGLEKLIDLNICFNQTDDLVPLYGLKGLERLWLYNVNNRSSNDLVSQELVGALQAALPDTLINCCSYSTLGGWRTHPRYYVVFNMLHGAVAWLPWDAQGLVPKYQ